MTHHYFSHGNKLSFFLFFSHTTCSSIPQPFLLNLLSFVFFAVFFFNKKVIKIKENSFFLFIRIYFSQITVRFSLLLLDQSFQIKLGMRWKSFFFTENKQKRKFFVGSEFFFVSSIPFWVDTISVGYNFSTLNELFGCRKILNKKT